MSDDQNWLRANVVNRTKIKVSCSQNDSSPRSGFVTITCGNEKSLLLLIKMDGQSAQVVAEMVKLVAIIIKHNGGIILFIIQIIIKYIK